MRVAAAAVAAVAASPPAEITPVSSSCGVAPSEMSVGVVTASPSAAFFAAPAVDSTRLDLYVEFTFVLLDRREGGVGSFFFLGIVGCCGDDLFLGVDMFTESAVCCCLIRKKITQLKTFW